MASTAKMQTGLIELLKALKAPVAEQKKINDAAKLLKRPYIKIPASHIPQVSAFLSLLFTTHPSMQTAGNKRLLEEFSNKHLKNTKVVEPRRSR